MSKVKFKKALNEMTKEQIIELLLDIYDGDKFLKEFVKFYLDPDEKALFDKYYESLKKEIFRWKRGYCIARVSKIKALLKEFEFFKTGFVSELNIYFLTLELLLIADKNSYISDAHRNLSDFLVEKILTTADKNYEFDKALERFDNQIFNKALHRHAPLLGRMRAAIAEYKPVNPLKLKDE